MDGEAGGELAPRPRFGPEPWTPTGSVPPGEHSHARQAEVGARWHTVWWLMVVSLFVAACAFTVAWFGHQTAQAFDRSAHPASGEVVESDCWVLCRGGPVIMVAYTHPQAGRLVGRLHADDRRNYVGDNVTVVYSDDPAAQGVLALPPAQTISQRINEVRSGGCRQASRACSLPSWRGHSRRTYAAWTDVTPPPVPQPRRSAIAGRHRPTRVRGRRATAPLMPRP